MFLRKYLVRNFNQRFLSQSLKLNSKFVRNTKKVEALPEIPKHLEFDQIKIKSEKGIFNYID